MEKVIYNFYSDPVKISESNFMLYFVLDCGFSINDTQTGIIMSEWTVLNNYIGLSLFHAAFSSLVKAS